MNVKKCEVTAFGAQRPQIEAAFVEAFPGISCVDPENATLLGAGLGNRAVQNELNSKSDNLQVLISKLHQLPLQAAFFLLKNCLFIPKFSYLLRASPCFKLDNNLTAIDTRILHELQRILNFIITENSKNQFTLLVKMGGFGIHCTTQHSTWAFISSMNATKTLRESLFCFERPSSLLQEEATHLWEEANGRSLEITESPWRQKSLTRPVFQRLQDSLLATVDRENMARILGCCAPGSGLWLDTLPSKSLGLTLSDEEFRIAAALRLGAPYHVQVHL